MGNFGTYNPDLNAYGSSPYLSPLQQSISAMKPFQPIAPANDAYKAKDVSGMSLPQYDAIRSRINSQFSQTQGQAQDSLDRQFAAMGEGPGNGAQAKQTENLAAGIAKAKSDALLGVDAQEAQTRTGLQQQESQKEFQSGEAEKARNSQLAEFNAQLAKQYETAGIDANSKLFQLDLGYKQAQSESAQNAYNANVAEYQAKHSGGLFGGGGFLGLGI